MRREKKEVKKKKHLEKFTEIDGVARRQSDLNFASFVQHYFLFTADVPQSKHPRMQT